MSPSQAEAAAMAVRGQDERFRVLVTGSRGWRDWLTLAWHLSAAVAEGQAAGRRVVVVHGFCPEGADRIADQLCGRFGVEPERHPAEWRKYGKWKAGFERNRKMVGLGASVVLAFLVACEKPQCAGKGPHPTHGGGHCAGIAAEAGIEVRRYGFGGQ